MQVMIHESVTNIDEEWPEQDWSYGVKIASSYVEFKDKFIEMLADFECMKEGSLGLMDITKHWVELFSADVKLIQSAPYCTGQ